MFRMHGTYNINVCAIYHHHTIYYVFFAFVAVPQSVFEVGRRYKIMNPDKMRAEYGKMMYILMDSSDSHVQVWCEMV